MLWAANRILQGRLPSLFNRASLTYLALLCLNIGCLLGSDGCFCVLGLLLVSQAAGLMNQGSLEELCSLGQAVTVHTATSSASCKSTSRDWQSCTLVQKGSFCASLASLNICLYLCQSFQVIILLKLDYLK